MNKVRTDVNLANYTVTPDPGAASFNNTLTGWTVGGGVEYMLNPNWTVKAEYLHFDLGNVNNTWNDIQVTHGDLTIDTVKLGVNYIWNRGYAPLK